MELEMDESGNLITSDNPLAPDQKATLQILVSMMIPASSEYGIPGADDPDIFADILTTARVQLESISQGMARLNARASEQHGRSFPDLSAGERSELIDEFRQFQAPIAAVLTGLVAQCYYRDDRVMRSLEMDPRPPHPQGFKVEDGDWSLLNPVKKRQKFYRNVP